MNSITANPIKTVKPIRWIGALQGLRAIAFLAIFLSHSGIGPFGCFGAWGVSLFLMMSGFFDVISISSKIEYANIRLFICMV